MRSDHVALDVNKILETFLCTPRREDGVAQLRELQES